MSLLEGLLWALLPTGKFNRSAKSLVGAAQKKP
jgi:hypothetical protein